ncbi:MAG: pyridoxamine 5'-phosphate oxidase family protein [Clostridia bacterium]
MIRKDRERNSDFAFNVFKNCEYASIATINSDGTAYSVPISVVLVDNFIYFHGATVGKKLENIAINKKICISAVTNTRLVPEELSSEFESAVAFGECELVTDIPEKKKALKAICEKYAKSHIHLFEETVSRYIDKTAICKITIEKITGKECKF